MVSIITIYVIASCAPVCFEAFCRGCANGPCLIIGAVRPFCSFIAFSWCVRIPRSCAFGGRTRILSVWRGFSPRGRCCFSRSAAWLCVGTAVPLAGGIVVVRDGCFLCFEEGVGPALGDVHEFVDQFFVLLVELLHLLLVLEVHRLVPQTVHLLNRVALQHPARSLPADRLQPLQVPPVLELSLHLVEGLGLDRHLYLLILRTVLTLLIHGQC